MAVNDGYTVLTVTPPVVNTAGGAVSFNPFGSVNQFRTTSFQDVMDLARTRHWSFATQKMGDGAAMLNLRLRERELLAKNGPDLEGIVGTTVTYSVSKSALTGSLVQIVGGVPVLAPAGADGWPVHINASGVPYVDFTEPQLAGDPLQVHGVGGLQGFPLPSTMIALIDCKLVWDTGEYVEVIIVRERRRINGIPDRRPVMFIANNRLIPMLPSRQVNGVAGPGACFEQWDRVTAVELSYIALPTPQTPDETITLPDVLAGALVAGLVKNMALQSRDVSVPEKQIFREEEQQALADMSDASSKFLSGPSHEDVQYN